MCVNGLIYAGQENTVTLCASSTPWRSYTNARNNKRIRVRFQI